MVKMDDLYQEHLKEKLDMVFLGSSGQKFSNPISNIILRKKVKNFLDFKNGFAIAIDEGKYNFVDENYDLLCKEWFDLVFDFKDGYALV